MKYTLHIHSKQYTYLPFSTEDRSRAQDTHTLCSFSVSEMMCYSGTLFSAYRCHLANGLVLLTTDTQDLSSVSLLPQSF